LFEDSVLTFNRLHTLHGKGVNSGTPGIQGSNLECVFLDGNEGNKRLEKYPGCNRFLVMN
jgi:hypothetical protein